MSSNVEQLVIGRIERATLLVVRQPFVRPFVISTASWSAKEALLLRLQMDGLEGWGECVADPDPYYAPETVATCRHVIKDFLWPMVRPGKSLAELFREFARVRGHEMAKATVENALLDLAARTRGLPLHELLGWPRRPIPSGISIGLQDTIDELLAAVGEAVARNYHRVKVKIKKGQELAVVRAVREAFPRLALMVDANGDYTLEDAPLLRELDSYDLMMIEQPLSYSDIYQHSLLQRQLATPICLDESIHSCADAEAALALGSCRVINIKQGRVGGMVHALSMAELAARAGVPVWSGGMDETGIGRACNLHLQACPYFSLPGDTSETRRYFEEDIVEPPVVLDEQGFIAIPEGAGIGVSVVAERVLKRLVFLEQLPVS